MLSDQARGPQCSWHCLLIMYLRKGPEGDVNSWISMKSRARTSVSLLCRWLTIQGAAKIQQVICHCKRQVLFELPSSNQEGWGFDYNDHLQFWEYFLYARPHAENSIQSPHFIFATILKSTDSVTPIYPWDFPGKSTGVGCHFLLQRIFLTQGSNLGLLHCRQMLYPLSHQGSPFYICAK